MRPLRVLLTNGFLSTRTGSELYVRDVATGLLRRGLAPVVYSPVLGTAAAELRLASVPVVDDLAAIQTVPDVIHGQHHLETMTALQRFPEVPAVFVCHGFLPWEETAPLHPRILRYVAVDEPTRDRLVVESGIPEEMVEVVLNFVDTSRFAARGPLPDHPRRALLFSNHAREGALVDAIREGCGRFGILLELAGEAAGRVLADPGPALAQYDVVFARGRSAIEALAVGCAVVITGLGGLGPMVTLDRFPELRRLNFGLRSIAPPVTADRVASELARYDARDALEVSRRIRAEADAGPAVDTLLGIYTAVREAGAPNDTGAESEATARYLRWLSLSIRGKVAGLDHVPVYAARLEAMREELAAAMDAGTHLQIGRQTAEAGLEATRKEADALRAERDRLVADLAALRASDSVDSALGAQAARLARSSFRRLAAYARGRRGRG